MLHCCTLSCHVRLDTSPEAVHSTSQDAGRATDLPRWLLQPHADAAGSGPLHPPALGLHGLQMAPHLATSGDLLLQMKDPRLSRLGLPCMCWLAVQAAARLQLEAACPCSDSAFMQDVQMDYLMTSAKA